MTAPSLLNQPAPAGPRPPQDTKIAEVCATAPGGLTGFPTWIMPNGEQLVGEQSFAELEAALEKALAANAGPAASAS